MYSLHEHNENHIVIVPCQTVATVGVGCFWFSNIGITSHLHVRVGSGDVDVGGARASNIWHSAPQIQIILRLIWGLGHCVPKSSLYFPFSHKGKIKPINNNHL